MGNHTFNEIETQMGEIPPKRIVQALGTLLDNQEIKKEKIEMATQQATTEIEIAKSLLNVKEKADYHYVLTENGKRKLAWLEWKYQLYTEIPSQALPWGDGFNQQYYDDMSERIRKNGWPTA